MVSVDISLQEATFLLALLEADRQTALQLLAADHVYEPSLLPKLRKAHRKLRKMAKEAA